MALLTVENLRAYYKTEMYGISRLVRAIDDVSLELQPNEIYGVAGESSCGKTTLIKVLSGTIKPPLKVHGGNVKYRFKSFEVDMAKVSDEELRQNIRWKEISYVMQGSMSVLNPVRKVVRTFEDIISTHEGIRNRKEFLERIKEHVKKLGLPPDVLNAYPHELSGGMRQRAAIALATVFHPSLIIADEPTTALDVVVQRGVLQLLREIQGESKNTVLLVTHDMAVHANVANRVAIMYAGHLMEEAPTEIIFKRPEHPYTKHLISSLPVIGDKSVKSSLEGSPPNLANPPEGCRFHPRCPRAAAVCKTEIPGMRDLGGGHRAACHLIAEPSGGHPAGEGQS
jgi:peptide/nickel transport system ATP-binding protein